MRAHAVPPTSREPMTANTSRQASDGTPICAYKQRRQSVPLNRL
jgi:hypothetical protein